MNMRTIIKRYLLLSMSAFLLTACDLVGSIDDIEQKYVLTDENVISDATSAEVALNGVYASWRNIRIAWFRHYLNALTGTETEANIVGMTGFSNNNVLDTNTGVADNYIALYNVVNNATSFIDNVSKGSIMGLTDERKTEAIAEARFHRAMAYLYLLRQYGEFYHPNSTFGIVLYKDKPVRDNESIARSTVRESYDAILSDLDYAISNAPLYTYHYKVCRLTAQALKARVLLYAQDYRNAAATARQVIDEGAAYGYYLEDDFTSIFSKSYMSPEVIFALYNSYPNERDADSNWNQYAGNTIMTLAYGMGSDDGVDRRYFNTFENLDPSKYWLRNNKYPNYYYDTAEPENTYFFIRMAEMYYILAEAEMRQGNETSARQALKDIICNDRAGYSEEYVDNINSAAFLVAVLEHKWLELATENNEEWYDLIRHHVIDGLAIAPTYVKSDTHLTMPIPRTALAGNNLLRQNPSYDQKNE